MMSEETQDVQDSTGDTQGSTDSIQDTDQQMSLQCITRKLRDSIDLNKPQELAGSIDRQEWGSFVNFLSQYTDPSSVIAAPQESLSQTVIDLSYTSACMAIFNNENSPRQPRKSTYQVGINDTSVFLDVLVSCLDGDEALPNHMTYDRLFILVLRMYKDSDWPDFFHKVIPSIRAKHRIHMQLDQSGAWSDPNLLQCLCKILQSYLLDGSIYADGLSEDSFSCVRAWYVNVQKRLGVQNDFIQHAVADANGRSDSIESIAAKTRDDVELLPGMGQTASSSGATEVKQESRPLALSGDDCLQGIQAPTDCDTATSNKSGGISSRHSYCLWRDYFEQATDGATIGVELPQMLVQALQTLEQGYRAEDFALLARILSQSPDYVSQVAALEPIQKDLCMLSLLRFKPALVNSMVCPHNTDLSLINDDFMYGLAESDIDYRPLSQKCLKVSYQTSVGVMFLGALAFIFTGASLAFLAVGASILLLGAVVYFSAKSSVKKWNANQKKPYTIAQVRQSFLQGVQGWAKQESSGPVPVE